MDEQARKKWKRDGIDDERVLNQGLKMMTLPLSPIHPQSQPEKQENEDIGGDGGGSASKIQEKSMEEFQCQDDEDGNFQRNYESLDSSG